MFLLDELLLLPVQGLLGIFKEIQKMADQELNDVSLITDKLLELQLRYEMDEIGDDEYNRGEEILRSRLNELRESQGL